jgi:hypothetical protein
MPRRTAFDAPCSPPRTRSSTDRLRPISLRPAASGGSSSLRAAGCQRRRATRYLRAQSVRGAPKTSRSRRSLPARPTIVAGRARLSRRDTWAEGRGAAGGGVHRRPQPALPARAGRPDQAGGAAGERQTARVSGSGDGRSASWASTSPRSVPDDCFRRMRDLVSDRLRGGVTRMGATPRGPRQRDCRPGTRHR